MWFQIELPQPAMLTEIQFTSTALAVDTTPIVPGAPTRTGIPGGRGAPGAAPPAPPPLGFPREYQVQVSMDGTTWGQPVARGKGTGTLTRYRLCAGSREIRAHHAVGNRRRSMDHPAAAPLRDVNIEH